MLIILLDIVIAIRTRKRAITQPNPAATEDGGNKRQKNLQNQMFILMLASIGIFFVTNLPLGIGKIILPRDTQVISSAGRLTTIWTILGWVQSFNSAVSLHCCSKANDNHRFSLRSISTFIASVRHCFARSFYSK